MFRSCCVSGLGTVPGRSSQCWWDGPKDGCGPAMLVKDCPMRMLVRYAFKPMLVDLALVRSRSATSVLRHRPVILGFGMLFTSFSVLCSLGLTVLRFYLGRVPL